jgi:transposase-like protein
MDREAVGSVSEMKDAAETEGARRATRVSADAGVAPDPEVVAKAKRRRFRAEYRLKVLRQADACKAPGELGALLRREGLYSSLLSTWRRQREQGALAALRACRRGPKPKAVDPRVKELEKQNACLQRKLKQVEMIVEVQKKVHEILGIPLRTLADEGDD